MDEPPDDELLDDELLDDELLDDELLEYVLELVEEVPLEPVPEVAVVESEDVLTCGLSTSSTKILIAPL